ncbi:phage tail protein [Pandoraea sp. PE-S2T-3]|uniref:phage tail protein n=1 Tax=Pandoraea sp. PE-S2T-3 TaxID=1986993 RepID=UPI000B4060BE|nr:tail fiber protein [Pandoraea sp. PE-S2T-3]
MDDYYIGEIRLYAFNYAPVDWAVCDGTILQIRFFPELYAVIGTTYGGDGRTTFAVPDLRGLVSRGTTEAAQIGKVEGSPTVTLQDQHMPLHTHTAYVNSTRPAGDSASDKLPARFVVGGNNAYRENTSDLSLVSLSPLTVGPACTGGAHNNMQPYLPLNFCIAIKNGEFPPRP